MARNKDRKLACVIALATSLTVRSRVRLLVILSFGLTSCMLPMPTAKYEMTDKQSAEAGEVVVFGRVNFVEEGKELSWAGSQPGKECHVVLVNEATSKAEAYYLKGYGSFYWHLPPGKYEITGFTWVTALTLTGRMLAEFTISPEQQPTYIGTLVVSFPKGRFGGGYSLMISDEYDQAVAALRTRYPALQGAPVKRLMQLGDNR